MPNLNVAIAAGALALLVAVPCSASAQGAIPPIPSTPGESVTPGGAVTPEQAAKNRELEAMGEAFFTMLKDKSRCGAPAPAGYACALVLYKDTRETRVRDHLPETLVTQITGLTDAGGSARDAKVRILSVFEADTARTVSPLQMPRLIVSLASNTSGKEKATLEMQAVLGYAENEALPKGDKRKIDRAIFKIAHEGTNRF